MAQMPEKNPEVQKDPFTEAIAEVNRVTKELIEQFGCDEDTAAIFVMEYGYKNIGDLLDLLNPPTKAP